MQVLLVLGFLEFTWLDVLDIGLVGYLLYHLHKLLRNSGAVRIFMGFLFVYLTWLVVRAAEMQLLSAILQQFMGVGVIALIILFQQEIRKFLLMIGKSTSLSNRGWLAGLSWKRSEAADRGNFNLLPIAEAARSMTGSNTGALIVFSRTSELKFYAESGDEIDAIVSKRMLLTIFQKSSPMHDGAVIVENNRIRAARCILPVSENQDIPAAFGLRHRAALGISETTDAVVLVVSEETGQVSLVKSGRLWHNIPVTEVRSRLELFLADDGDEVEHKMRQEGWLANVKNSNGFPSSITVQ